MNLNLIIKCDKNRQRIKTLRFLTLLKLYVNLHNFQKTLIVIERVVLLKKIILRKIIIIIF